VIYQNRGSGSISGLTATGGMAQPTFFKTPPSSTLADIAALANAQLADPAGVAGFHTGKRESTLMAPSSTLLFLEEAAPGHPDRSTNDGYFDPRNDQVTTRHRDSANYAFCDGHITHIKRGAAGLPRYPNPGGDPRFEP